MFYVKWSKLRFVRAAEFGSRFTARAIPSRCVMLTWSLFSTLTLCVCVCVCVFFLSSSSSSPAMCVCVCFLCPLLSFSGQHLLGEFRKESGIDLSGDTLAMQRLREAAEKVKERKLKPFPFGPGGCVGGRMGDPPKYSAQPSVRTRWLDRTPTLTYRRCWCMSFLLVLDPEPFFFADLFPFLQFFFNEKHCCLIICYHPEGCFWRHTILGYYLSQIN